MRRGKDKIDKKNLEKVSEKVSERVSGTGFWNGSEVLR